MPSSQDHQAQDEFAKTFEELSRAVMSRATAEIELGRPSVHDQQSKLHHRQYAAFLEWSVGPGHEHVTLA